jgi:hypothetical protein
MKGGTRTYIQAHVQLPPKQVHQRWYKGSSYEAAEIPDEQERRERPKQTKPEAKGNGIAEEEYDPRIAQPSHFAHPFGHPVASSSTGFSVNQMQWFPPPMMPTYPIWDPYYQI